MLDKAECELSPHEKRISIVRRHFEQRGYRVHSGLQFGCELVLYADDPDKVHSDFCVNVLAADSGVNWMQLQTLARSMSALHKQLIVVNVERRTESSVQVKNKSIIKEAGGVDYIVHELAIASGHAPFRHKRKETIPVGSQKKKLKTKA